MEKLFQCEMPLNWCLGCSTSTSALMRACGVQCVNGRVLQADDGHPIAAILHGGCWAWHIVFLDYTSTLSLPVELYYLTVSHRSLRKSVSGAHRPSQHQGSGWGL